MANSRPQTQLTLPNDAQFRPVASPTDQFHAPAVAAPNTDASQWLAVSKALSELEPQVGQIFERRFRAYTQTSQLAAGRDVAEQRLDSMAKLRAAVKDGKIAEGDNPWYMAQAEEEVGRVTARRVAAEAWQEYENDPALRKSDDVRVVDKFFSDRFAQVVKDEGGGSVWAISAMGKVFEESKDQLIRRHVEVRSRERVEEREVSSKAEIGDLLSQLDGPTLQAARNGDPNAIAHVTEAKAALQAKLDSMLLTVDRYTANKWVKEAVIDHALAVEDAEVARELIGGLTKADGKGLLMNDADRTMLRNLGDRVTDLKNHRLQLEEAAERRADEHKTREVSATLYKAIADAKDKGQEFDFHSPLTPEQMRTLSPRVQNAIVQEMSALSAFNQQGQNIKDENQRRAVLRKSAGDYVNGRLSPDQSINFTDMLLQAGGHHDLATLANTKRALEDMAWPQESKPEVLGDLINQISEGEMAGRSGIDRLVETGKSGKLSARDFRELSFFLLGRQARGDQWQDRGEFQVSAERLATLIFDKRTDTVQPGSVSEQRLDTILRNSTNKARAEFLFAYNEMTQSPEWAKIKDVKERQQRITDLVDKVAKDNGGYTQAEAVKATTDRLAKEQKEQAEAEKRAAAKQQKTAPPATDVTVDKYTRAGDEALKLITPEDQADLKLLKLDPDDTVPDPKLRKKMWDAKGAGTYWSWKTRQGDPFAQLQFLRSYEKGSTNLTGNVAASSPPPKTAEIVSAWQRSIDQAKSLQHTIIADDIPARLRNVMADVRAQGFATKSDVETYKWLWGRVREYALIRKYAGYDLDEIKTLGKDAHLYHKMFANEADVDARGPAVGQKLGLSPQDTAIFMSRQKKIIYMLDNDE